MYNKYIQEAKIFSGAILSEWTCRTWSSWLFIRMWFSIYRTTTGHRLKHMHNTIEYGWSQQQCCLHSTGRFPSIMYHHEEVTLQCCLFAYISVWGSFAAGRPFSPPQSQRPIYDRGWFAVGRPAGVCRLNYLSAGTEWIPHWRREVCWARQKKTAWCIANYAEKKFSGNTTNVRIRLDDTHTGVCSALLQAEKEKTASSKACTEAQQPSSLPLLS